jgi:hypothetical protein
MKSPENTNPAILKGFLSEMETLPSYNGLVEYQSNEVEEESK